MQVAIPQLKQGLPPHVARRWYTAVISWGRNLEGQAGIEGVSVVHQPSCILELHGSPVSVLTASKLTSAAVIQHEGMPHSELHTWGDGWGGKLGHGHCDSLHAPCRVEALVYRAHVKGVALGDHHSLLVDHQGQVWAFGENKEGQCGLGTPLEVMAQQRKSAYATFQSTDPHGRSPLSRTNTILGSHQHAASSHIWDSSSLFDALPGIASSSSSSRRQPGSTWRPQQGQQTQGGGRAWWHHPGYMHSLWATHQHQAAAAAAGLTVPDATLMMATRASRDKWGAGALSSAGGGSGGGGSHAAATHTPAAALTWGGADMTAYLSARGAQPGHQVVPARLGRDLHPLAQPDGGHSASFFSTPGGPVGIEQEHVVHVAAGKHYSVAVDAAGQVWTFGACFNGCLGSHNTWISTAQRVDGELAATLEAEGGATSVAAGGTFCVATTSSGKAVVWGTLPPAPTPNPNPTPSAASAAAPARSVTSALIRDRMAAEAGAGKVKVLAGVIHGLPAITQVAAGEQHALLSDGERVWMIGRSLGPGGGKEVMAAPWDTPLEVLHVPGGVKHVRAGTYSSAVVTCDGKLYMWGRLLDAQHAALLIRRQRDRVWPHREVEVPDDAVWSWSGFGAATPTAVDGLSGPVADIALGGWHAMALIH